MHADQDEPVIIELDDPTPRGAGIIGVVLVVAILGMILAPFLINFQPAVTPAEDRPSHVSNDRQLCQPQFEVPKFLEPVTHFTLPGFMRLCTWFAPPENPDAALSPRDRDVLQPVSVHTTIASNPHHAP